MWREDRADWTQHDELMATAIEVTDAWGRQIVQAVVEMNGGKVRLPEPLRVDHPDRPKPEQPKKRNPASPEETAAFFGARIQ